MEGLTKANTRERQSQLRMILMHAACAARVSSTPDDDSKFTRLLSA